ncbi:MAG TPA: IS21 family transposase [Bacteroidales bacterium]|nr:IS21 family transposase [Bacteroidales bacterium]
MNVSERSARRFVEGIRKKYSIPKIKGRDRQYAAVEELPMGYQMQADLGIACVFDFNKRNYRKIYCLACVLSHSRYKWGEWYINPLTSGQLVAGLQDCFEYMGGMPKQIVFDQDRLLAVDENYGDIIFTKEFEQFRLSSGFDVYLCRGGDPESKGKVEATVKYFKNNYAKNRQFINIGIWNEAFYDWLERTGNAKTHGITKKIPAEIFEQERYFLKPVPSFEKTIEDIVTREIHKNNTIFYKGNRYTLPLGTYRPGRKVKLDIEGELLIIRDDLDGYIIAKHKISNNKGELIQNNNHKRDTTKKLDSVQDSLFKTLGLSEEADIFLKQVRRLKSRYARDQFSLIEKTLSGHSGPAIDKALNYCVFNSLFSAVEFRNATEYFEALLEKELQDNDRNPKVIVLNTAATAKKRPLSEYERIVKGGDF